MKKVILESFLCIFIILLALFSVKPVFAHVAEPRLEISMERINPGGTMDMRGVGFDYEEAATLYLVRPGIMIHMGDIVADSEGVFFQTVILPADLPEGIYNFRAVTEHHEILSPSLTVQGPAILSESGGQGERDEDDGLLAPMPTFAPGVVPGGTSQPAAVKTSQEAPSEMGATPDRTVTLLISSVVFVFGMLVWLRQKSVRRR